MAQRTGLGKGLGSLIPKKNPSSNQSKADKKQEIKKPVDTTPVSFSVSDFAKNARVTPSISSTPKMVVKDEVENAESVTQVNAIEVLELPVEDIVPNPMQPRQIFGHKELDDLVSSIKEHGVLQPITVTRLSDGKYELIAGERRLRSSKIAGRKTIPAIIRTAGEMEKLELALIENIQRQDLNPIEKAESYYRLMDEFGLTQEKAANRLGIQRSTMANTLRLLQLPGEIQRALADGKLTQGHARALVALDSRKDQMRLFKKILFTGMNVRDAESQVREISKTTKKSYIDPNVQALQDEIQQALGTRVELKRQKKGGKIIIHYYSSEELDNLLDIFNS